jgi:hypothetical protein
VRRVRLLEWSCEDDGSVDPIGSAPSPRNGAARVQRDVALGSNPEDGQGCGGIHLVESSRNDEKIHRREACPRAVCALTKSLYGWFRYSEAPL